MHSSGNASAAERPPPALLRVGTGPPWGGHRKPAIGRHRSAKKGALFLAHGGIDPRTGHRVIDAQAARRINALMMTCGHYDGSGDFAFRVGLSGKSGVGGGILAIAPGKAAIAVWAPGLNEAGNSLVGALALESLSRRAGWSVF